MVSKPLLWPFLSSLVFISVTHFFFHITSAITTTTAAFRRWTSDVIQPSSLGSGLAAAVVKEFHTAQTTAARITTTNIAPITILKLPQRSSCANLQNRESLNAVGDRTRRSKFLYGWSRAPRASRLLHAPPRARFLLLTSALGDIICHDICWRHCWPDRWLTLTLIVDFSTWLTFLVQVFRVDFIFAVCFCILCL